MSCGPCLAVAGSLLARIVNLATVQVASKAGWLAVTVKAICNLVLDILIQQKETDQYPLCETDLGTGVLLYMLSHLWLSGVVFLFGLRGFVRSNNFSRRIWSSVTEKAQRRSTHLFWPTGCQSETQVIKPLAAINYEFSHDLELMGNIFCQKTFRSSTTLNSAMDHIIDSGWYPNMVLFTTWLHHPMVFCIFWWPETSTDETHKVVVKQTWSIRILRGSFAYTHARHQWILGELDYQIYWKRRPTDISSIGHQCCHPAPVTSAWLTCTGFMWHVCVVCWDSAKGLLGDMPSLLVFSILTIVQPWSDRENHYKSYRTLPNKRPSPPNSPKSTRMSIPMSSLLGSRISCALFHKSGWFLKDVPLYQKTKWISIDLYKLARALYPNDSHKIRNAAIFWDICVYLYLLVAPPDKKNMFSSFMLPRKA